MFNFFKKIFPSKHEKDVKELWPYVEEINQYYEEFQKLSDDELRQKTQEFRELINTNKQEIEDRILELGEKLKTNITHAERQEIYDELAEQEKDLHDTIEDTLNEILP